MTDAVYSGPYSLVVLSRPLSSQEEGAHRMVAADTPPHLSLRDRTPHSFKETSVTLRATSTPAHPASLSSSPYPSLVVTKLWTMFEEANSGPFPSRSQEEMMPIMPRTRVDQKKKTRCQRCHSTTHKTPQCTRRRGTVKCPMCGDEGHQRTYHQVLKLVELPEQVSPQSGGTSTDGCLDRQLYGTEEQTFPLGSENSSSCFLDPLPDSMGLDQVGSTWCLEGGLCHDI